MVPPCSLIHPDFEEWGESRLYKSGNEASYKQLPIEPAEQKTSIVAMRRPQPGNWLGFATRTLVCGSVSAVTRYSILARIWAAKACRLAGIPLVRYFGDFASMARAGMADESARVFPRFCYLMEFALEPAKSSVGNSVVFIGAVRAFPSPENGHNPPSALTEANRGRRPHLLAPYLKLGRIAQR